MKSWLLIGVFLLVAGCVMGDKVKSLEPGMTKQQVISRLGKPDGYVANGNSEVMSYTNELITGNSWDRADYNVVLTNGRVTAYGPSTVRQNRPPVTPVWMMGNVTTTTR